MNQEVKMDKGKYRPSIVPVEGIVQRVAPVREYGIKKYNAPDNWRKVEVERYEDAFLRHMLAWWSNRSSRDRESGLLHFDHMLCNALFLAEMTDLPIGGNGNGEL